MRKSPFERLSAWHGTEAYAVRHMLTCGRRAHTQNLALAKRFAETQGGRRSAFGHRPYYGEPRQKAAGEGRGEGEGGKSASSPLRSPADGGAEGDGGARAEREATRARERRALLALASREALRPETCAPGVAQGVPSDARNETKGGDRKAYIGALPPGRRRAFSSLGSRGGRRAARLKRLPRIAALTITLEQMRRQGKASFARSRRIFAVRSTPAERASSSPSRPRRRSIS